MTIKNNILTSLAGFATLAFSSLAMAQVGVIYDGNDGGLKSGWQDWSWAEIEMQSPVSGDIYPIKITADEWEALQLGRPDPVSVDESLALEFYINGGLDGGQRVAVQFANGEEQVGETFVINPKAKAWSPVVIDLEELGVSGQINIIRVICQQQSACGPFYVDKMFFGQTE